MQLAAGSYGVLDFTPSVHTISSHHFEQVVRALLEAGARKEIKNSSGSTALSIAKSKGHTAICKLLEP